MESDSHPTHRLTTRVLKHLRTRIFLQKYATFLSMAILQADKQKEGKRKQCAGLVDGEIWVRE